MRILIFKESREKLTFSVLNIYCFRNLTIWDWSPPFKMTPPSCLPPPFYPKFLIHPLLAIFGKVNQKKGGWCTKKLWFPEILKQFWATAVAKLQSDRRERGYFHKIWMEYYCLSGNCGSGKLSLKFTRCQNLYEL